MKLGHVALESGDPAGSSGLFERALASWRDQHDAYNVPRTLEGLAWAALAAGQAARAARLLGAAEALRESVGAVVLPHLQADHDRAVAAVQAALEERACAAAWRRGRAMSLKRAVLYALSPEAGPGAGAGESGPSADAGRVQLTRREREVAALVAAGRTSPEIARALAVSERTVEWHVANLLDKCGVRSRTQFALWAVGQGLVAENVADEDSAFRSA